MEIVMKGRNRRKREIERVHGFERERKIEFGQIRKLHQASKRKMVYYSPSTEMGTFTITVGTMIMVMEIKPKRSPVMPNAIATLKYLTGF